MNDYNEVIIKKSILCVFCWTYIFVFIVLSILFNSVIYIKYGVFFFGIPWQPALLLAIFATIVDYFVPGSKLIITNDTIIKKTTFGKQSIKTKDIKIKNVWFIYLSVYSFVHGDKFSLSPCYSKKTIINMINNRLKDNA